MLSPEIPQSHDTMLLIAEYLRYYDILSPENNINNNDMNSITSLL